MRAPWAILFLICLVMVYMSGVELLRAFTSVTFAGKFVNGFCGIATAICAFVLFWQCTKDA